MDLTRFNRHLIRSKLKRVKSSLIHNRVAKIPLNQVAQYPIGIRLSLTLESTNRGQDWMGINTKLRD